MAKTEEYAFAYPGHETAPLRLRDFNKPGGYGPTTYRRKKK